MFVDYSKCASPKDAVERRWERLAKHVEMSGPYPIESFLGRLHTWGTSTFDGEPVRTIEYVMIGFMNLALDCKQN